MTVMTAKPLLPPPLIHVLRGRSFSRLFRMTGSPGNRGFGRVLRQRIRLVVARERFLVEKAISVAYLGSYLTDHVVFAEKEAARLIENRDLTSSEEGELWDRNYPVVVARLLGELPDGPLIKEELTLLNNYTTLPQRLYRFRARHWRLLQMVLQNALADSDGNLTEIPLVNRIHSIIAGARAPASRALGICLAASLLADMECWSSHLAWPEAYEKVMVELYPLLNKHPETLEAIVRLD